MSEAAPATSPEQSALGVATAADLDLFLRSTGTPWGSTRWDEVARCEVAAARRYEPGRYKLPMAKTKLDIMIDEGPDDSAETIMPEAEALSNSAIARQVGSLWHAMIAWLADGEMTGAARSWRDVLTRANEQGDAWDPVALLEARRIAIGYFQHWGTRWQYEPAEHDGGGMLIEAVELGLHITVGLLPWTTQADLILRDVTTDRLVIVDHKSRKSKPSGSSTLGFKEAVAVEARVRPQFLGTAYAVRRHYELDYYPDMVVNCVVKSKELAFCRARVKMGAQQVAMWKQAQEDFAARRAAGIEPIPNMRECFGQYGKCWAYDRCHGET